jgi:thiol-disulfide isomerase/thioredoxin
MPVAHEEAKDSASSIGDESNCAEPPAAPSAKVLDAVPLAELLGSAKQGRAVKGTVVLFLGTECPVSNGYAPEMERIYQESKSREVAVVGVYAEPTVTAAEAEAHGKEYGLTFPRSLDPEQAIARAAEVKRMPTAVVFDAGGKVVYRGRVDDRWSPEGKRRDVPRTRELRDAIDAVVEGRAPKVSEAPPFGCPLPTLKTTAKQPK